MNHHLLIQSILFETRWFHLPRNLRAFSQSTIILFTILFSFFSKETAAQGTWTKLVNEAPDHNGGGMLLLSDGTVLAKSFSGVCDVWSRNAKSGVDGPARQLVG